jgi:hypothetical protein
MLWLSINYPLFSLFSTLYNTIHKSAEFIPLQLQSITKIKTKHSFPLFFFIPTNSPRLPPKSPKTHPPLLGRDLILLFDRGPLQWLLIFCCVCKKCKWKLAKWTKQQQGERDRLAAAVGQPLMNDDEASGGWYCITLARERRGIRTLSLKRPRLQGR